VGDFESESEYQASIYNYDTSSEIESSKPTTLFDSKKKKKSFKPSSKKKIQLTFENLSVKTIPKRKSTLCFKHGEPSPPKVVLDKISGTFVPGQFVAILGTSGNIFALTF
jgi:hypothetical protein